MRLPTSAGRRAVRVPSTLRANYSTAGDKRRPRESLLRRNLAPLSPPTPPPSDTQYSPLTVSLVKGMGRLLGYNFVRSKAIKVTGDLYDRAAMRAQAEAHFWYKECALPASFQTWFQLTNLHMFLLLSRFRALSAEEAREYTQELVNHFFIDTESRMRERFGVQTSRLVKGYMKDLHLQHRGSIVAYEEGLATDDVRLSGAIWRNVWGGGWGVIGGVKRKMPLLGRKKHAQDVQSDEGAPELAMDKEAPVLAAAEPDEDSAARAELLFPQHLERVTRWLRREVYRLGHLPNEVILDGDVHAPRASPTDDVIGPPAPVASAPVASTAAVGGQPEVVSAYTRI
ncbi:beta-ketoacyl-[acyl-carrier-protein] synthase II [Malassezia nana]|uniref:Beta-ketoacyl-[acyl-carrier-protein] synthase II n=1 Tax=Malassezia nana TaxID=180528 RepID=A0AAF0J1B9_9BASI|nr:beta-ketoacyl-[acyl-carrier-protein] synthase II [Malassezia nana]